MNRHKFGWRLRLVSGPTSARSAGHPIPHNMTHYFDANMPNAVLAGAASVPAWLIAYIDPAESSMEIFLWKVLLPFVLFVIGKFIDIRVRLYLEKRRGDGSKENGNGSQYNGR